jgi:hypothetical protein
MATVVNFAVVPDQLEPPNHLTNGEKPEALGK